MQTADKLFPQASCSQLFAQPSGKVATGLQQLSGRADTHDEGADGLTKVLARPSACAQWTGGLERNNADY